MTESVSQKMTISNLECGKFILKCNVTGSLLFHTEKRLFYR